VQPQNQRCVVTLSDVTRSVQFMVKASDAYSSSGNT
jgi:hypothetical protein